MTARAAIALICALAHAAVADAEHDAERALRDAQQHAAAGDATAIDALEALGAARPVTRWTDDAWRTAAQLAERTHDFARAQRDLAQVIATSDDDLVVRRARADIERLAGIVGTTGEWNAVAATHDRLTARIRDRGDPAPALRELEALVRAHPRYPRAAMAMLMLADGWERDGETARAIGWLRNATRTATAPAERLRANGELVRMLIRHGEIEAAREAIGAVTDPALAARLRQSLATAELRRTIRWLVTAVLVVIAAAAALGLRRAAGSWRAVPRRLLRPPPEVLFFAPVAGVFAIVALSGNLVVAHAVWAIAIVGTVVAWISGAILEGKRGHTRPAGLVVHAVLAAVAVLAAAYIAIDRDRMIDLVVETWRGGPGMR